MENRAHIILPTAAHTHTVIFLHGRDSTASEFAPEFFESQASDDRTLLEIFPGIRWIFPTGGIIRSARFGSDMSQWFDMRSTENPHERHEHDNHDKELQTAVNFVTDIVNKEAASIGSENVFLGGISQGCSTAMHALLRNDKRLAGFIGLCSWFANCQNATSTPTTQASRTPIMLSHAQDDDIIDMKFGLEARDRLIGMGMEVQWHAYEDGGHWINEPKGVDDIVAFMQLQIRK